MTKIFQGRKERDEYDIFGEQVACKLRKLSNYGKITVQHIINNVLWEAELGKYDNHPSISNTDPVLISSPGINYNSYMNPISKQYASSFTNNQLSINNSIFDIPQPSSSYSFPSSCITKKTPQHSSETPLQTPQTYTNL